MLWQGRRGDGKAPTSVSDAFLTSIESIGHSSFPEQIDCTLKASLFHRALSIEEGWSSYTKLTAGRGNLYFSLFLMLRAAATFLKTSPLSHNSLVLFNLICPQYFLQMYHVVTYGVICKQFISLSQRCTFESENVGNWKTMPFRRWEMCGVAGMKS